MTQSSFSYIVLIFSLLSTTDVTVTFRLSGHKSNYHVNNMITTMASSTIQSKQKIYSPILSPKSTPSSSSATSYKIKSNIPSFNIPSSTDRRKLSYLTTENRVNSDMGIKVRSEYIKSRLLTASEEMLAGKTSSVGKKLESIRKTLRNELNREPTYDEWASRCNIPKSQLETYINTASQARNILVTHNMRLVDYVVRGILESSKATKSLSYFELVTEGIIGLTEAAELYDGRCRFATYAHYFIKSAVHKCITRLQPGTLVNHDTAMLYSKMKKTAYALKQEYNREPTDEELCKVLKWKPQYLYALRNRATKKLTSAEKDFTSENVKSSQNGLQSSVTQNYFDLDLTTPQIESDHTQNLLWKTNFKTALNVLEPNERRVLGLRYGFIDGVSRTIPLTAELMCVTEESIRLITQKAFEKLKSYKLSNDILLNGPPEIEPSSLNGKISAKLY